MRTTIKERALLLTMLFVFLACMFRYIPGFKYDLECFDHWARMIHQFGLPSVYTISGTNYLPFYQYILWIYQGIAGSEADITAYIRELRLFTLLFELIGLWYIYKWTDKKTDFMMLVLISLLNIGFSYNTIAWAQLDGIFSAFVFIALYYAYKQDMFWSGAWMILALNAKLQAIIFAPLWLLLCLNHIADKRSLKAALYPVLGVIVMQFIILLPFITSKRELNAIWDVVTGSDNVFPRISMQAYNIWYLVAYDEVVTEVQDDTLYLGGLTYKQVGLLMFAFTSGLAMLPVVKDVYRTIKYKTNCMYNKERLWLSAAAVCLCFFFFNTEMHERYCHPVIVFLTAYAFYARRFALYGVFSLAYFLNMERILSDNMYPHPHYSWFNERNIAWLFAVVLGWMFIRLYTLKDRQIRQDAEG